MFARVKAAFCALAVLGFCRTAAAVDPTYFALDPAQSVLQISASLDIPGLGLSIPTIGQGTGGLGIPIFSDGSSGQLEGVITAKIDLQNDSIVLGGGSLHGRTSGIWEPLVGGDTGIDPAFVGLFIGDTTPAGTRIATAFRDFYVDYRNAYSTTDLTPENGEQFSFPANEWFDVSTNVDVQGQSGLGLLFDSGRLDLNETYGSQNAAGSGQLSHFSNDIWQLRVPVDTAADIDAGSVDGIGSIFVHLQIQGQIVGYSAPLPPAVTIASDGSHNSRETAQSLDGSLQVSFDPNVGNAIVNTSAGMPHVTIDGTLTDPLSFFSFTVTDPNTLGIFDVDGADFDSRLFLYAAGGALLATNDDAPYNSGALGSLSSLDSYLEYNFTQPGEYFLAISQFTPAGGPTVADFGGDYRLNVSLSTTVPEPSSAVLWIIGPLALALRFAWRRRRTLLVGLLAAWGAAMIAGPALATSVLVKDSIEDVYDRDGTYPMPYRLFTPPAAQQGQTYPLVLFLHGAGERGEDNYYQVASHIDGLIEATQSSAYESFLLAPQLTDFPGGPRRWTSSSPFDRTIELLTQIVQTYPVDPTRIYITGLSMGGIGTFEYMAEYPSLFAAAVPMSGGGDPGTASLIKDIPLWVFHGAMDQTVPVQYSRDMVNAITAAGGSPMYTELPNGPHDIWGPIYDDATLQQYGLYDWMFAQSNPGAMLAGVPEPSAVVLGATALAALAWLARARGRRGRSEIRNDDGGEFARPR